MKFSGKAKPIKKQKVKPKSASSTSPLRPLPAPFSVPPPPYNPVLNHPSPSVAPNQMLGRHDAREVQRVASRRAVDGDDVAALEQ